MNLHVPPDIAKQRQLQAMQRNQLYQTAFEIYKRLLAADYNKEDFERIAATAFVAAKVFNEAVHKHAEGGEDVT